MFYPLWEGREHGRKDEEGRGCPHLLLADLSLWGTKTCLPQQCPGTIPHPRHHRLPLRPVPASLADSAMLLFQTPHSVSRPPCHTELLPDLEHASLPPNQELVLVHFHAGILSPSLHLLSALYPTSLSLNIAYSRSFPYPLSLDSYSSFCVCGKTHIM